MGDHVKDAKAYVDGHKPGDVHPDVAAAMHRFTTAQESGSEVAVHAHARALVDMVALVGDDYVAPEPAPVKRAAPARKPAKKSTARKAAGGRSRS